MLVERPPLIYRMIFPETVWRIHKRDHTVYLTFDDGPIPDVTRAILDVLGRYGVKATFFVVGDNIRKYPVIYARIESEGHRVANHTFHHIKGTKFTTAEYLADIDACELVIADSREPGTERRLFRPPYGKMRPGQKRAVRERGYEIILWDVLTHDYNPRYTPEKMLRIVQQYTRDGSIINFHDSVKSGQRTIDVLPQVIEWLQANSYSIGLL